MNFISYKYATEKQLSSFFYYPKKIKKIIDVFTNYYEDNFDIQLDVNSGKFSLLIRFPEVNIVNLDRQTNWTTNNLFVCIPISATVVIDSSFYILKTSFTVNELLNNFAHSHGNCRYAGQFVKKINNETLYTETIRDIRYISGVDYTQYNYCLGADSQILTPISNINELEVNNEDFEGYIELLIGAINIYIRIENTDGVWIPISNMLNFKVNDDIIKINYEDDTFVQSLIADINDYRKKDLGNNIPYILKNFVKSIDYDGEKFYVKEFDEDNLLSFLLENYSLHHLTMINSEYWLINVKNNERRNNVKNLIANINGINKNYLLNTGLYFNNEFIPLELKIDINIEDEDKSKYKKVVQPNYMSVITELCNTYINNKISILYS